MRAYLPLPILLLAAGCGGPSRDQASQPPQASPATHSYSAEESMDESAARAPGAPGIGVTAAPGVAFNYRYAFRLPAQRIAAVQEEHAVACEKLGVDRCRITGMLYRLVNDRDIEAMLAFKLDPAAAREFGKQGIASVVRSEGMLTESEITGEDAGSEIVAATRSVAQLEEELRKIEAQLARPGLPPAERAELQAQAERLRESVRATRATRSERQESLAKTPVVFRYGSGELAPGFDDDSPIGDALRRAGDNVVGGVAVMIVLLITLVPCILLGALGLWVVLRVRRRFAARTVRTAPAIDG